MTNGELDGPFYTIDEGAFKLRLVLEDDEPLDEVCNVDGWVEVPGDGWWAATFFSLAEVGRLLAQRRAGEEYGAAAYFSCTDGISVREPGVDAILAAGRGLVTDGSYRSRLVKSVTS
ncbi:hypothetical protein E0H75_41000 [Kribbella capetownensis]|uniref:Uncharacterized protein n=1 Tax=Kribbella capetownensis TaxID=1572659 RepID=A0A4R0IY52_9ACTN|nr:hypothetical protein [Kribbella capetownensis]TCC36646.1 hypothetical protein E0H75_41000 [Kribbella capetownensis]